MINLLELNVDIQDRKAFEAIDIDKFINFVQSIGWITEIEDKTTHVLRKTFHFDCFVYIPKQHIKNYSDYASTLKSAFVQVAKYEGIPQLVLLQKLIGDRMMLRQIDVMKLWEFCELALSSKTGKAQKITIQQVAENSIVPVDYLLKNRKKKLWDNPLYLASAVEALHKISGQEVEYTPLYWLGDEPEGEG